MYHIGYNLSADSPWTIKYYYTKEGKRPFVEWFNNLDVTAQDTVSAYLSRMRAGNFNNCKPLKGIPDLCELIMNVGPGYRVYYIRAGKVLILTLCGGIKKEQDANIRKAVQCQEDFKTRRTAGTYDEPEFK